MQEKKQNGEILNMFESHAIMKYICQTRQLPINWYPWQSKDDQGMSTLFLRAKIDEYLDWHHGGIRMGAGAYFFRRFFSALMDKDGKGATKEAIKEAWDHMIKCMKIIE